VYGFRRPRGRPRPYSPDGTYGCGRGRCYLNDSSDKEGEEVSRVSEETSAPVDDEETGAEDESGGEDEEAAG